MSGLVEIQALVNEAQEKIKESDPQYVRTVLWPAIKSALGECTDIAWPDRRKMVLAIHKRLDESGLQGGEPAPINLETLKEDLEAGRVQVPKESQIFTWLPY